MWPAAPWGAMPYGVDSDSPVQDGELMNLDYGRCGGGYWSDLTQTVSLGRAPVKPQEMYEIVRIAQQAGREAAAGKTDRKIDAIAWIIIAKAGYGDNYGHGLRHGLGLLLQEVSILAPSAEKDMVLAPGMVATIEPGIYIEDLGGVRIEDDIMITEPGCELIDL